MTTWTGAEQRKLERLDEKSIARSKRSRLGLRL
jgi:hypothetical protein